ncbi:unnamed protein product [Blepharisma stoltei]|uniref:Brix domain-containing protein n=1 Tax=Blepharisma stoltei TaxID=1481888 RepID=A0AAU9K804_9CILI|nr:unnamed protein product [Blepharisma stoltei]
MPRRGRRRTKHRTHKEDDDEEKPVTIVSRRGKIGPILKHLVSELRIVLYPNCPLDFKESSKSNLKDLINMANEFEVNNMLFVTCTKNSTYLKAVKLPNGPTISFKILEYTLSSDVRASLKKASRLQPDFKSSPILIMRGVDGLPNNLFKSIFPTLDVSEIKLKKCKRVVLIDNQDDTLQMRHYLIKTRPTGISQSLKKIAKNQIPNLNQFNSVSEWLENSGNASESEGEEATVSDQSSKLSLRLVELGPRMSLKLHKIEEGICGGNVLYHSLIHKDPKAAKEAERILKEKKELKEMRKKIQEENVERKKQQKLARKKSKEPRKRRKLNTEDEEN